MKITDIVIKEKSIVLGVFDTLTFYKISSMEKVEDYASFQDRYSTYSIMDTVIEASNWADLIIFILDKVNFPINTKDSITCRELELICRDEVFFNKTIFVKGENVIEFDKNLVIT